jgi:glycosyltransferase involved in cell wall biosynthesis
MYQGIEVFDKLNIIYKHDETNPGISKAFNEGFVYAKNNQKKYIVFFDQDTLLPEDWFLKYKISVQKYSKYEIFVPIVKVIVHEKEIIGSPSKYYNYNAYPLENVEIGINSLDDITFCNSGMMVTTECYQKIGGYNEKIRLDFTDRYFVEKMKNYLKQFIVLDLEIYQHFSFIENDETAMLHRMEFYCHDGRVFVTTLRSLFYIARDSWHNSFELYKKYSNFRFLKIFIVNFIFGRNVKTRV